MRTEAWRVGRQCTLVDSLTEQFQDAYTISTSAALLSVHRQEVVEQLMARRLYSLPHDLARRAGSPTYYPFRLHSAEIGNPDNDQWQNCVNINSLSLHLQLCKPQVGNFSLLQTPPASARMSYINNWKERSEIKSIASRVPTAVAWTVSHFMLLEQVLCVLVHFCLSRNI